LSNIHPRSDHTPGVVVIGCSWGARLAEVTRHHKEARLLAVADLDRDKAEAVANMLGVQAFTDYQEALHLPDATTALVAVGPDLHKEVVAACCAAGLHVYVEKPAGHERRPEEVLEMAALAQQAGVRFMPGYSQRFAPYALMAAEVTRSGRLGAILSVDILRQAYFGPTWTQAPGWGIHDYDLCALLVGSPPIAVTAFAPIVGPYAAGHTTEVLIEHANGAISRCKTSMFTTRHEVTVRVHGDQGELVAEHIDNRLRVWTSEQEWETTYPKAPPFWQAALEAFFDYLAGRREQPVPPEEVLHGRKILDAAWRSLEDRGRVVLT
jgi:predicted dehydrogenase